MRFCILLGYKLELNYGTTAKRNYEWFTYFNTYKNSFVFYKQQKVF